MVSVLWELFLCLAFTAAAREGHGSVLRALCALTVSIFIMVISNRLGGSGIHSSAFTPFTSPIFRVRKGDVCSKEKQGLKG